MKSPSGPILVEKSAWKEYTATTELMSSGDDTFEEKKIGTRNGSLLIALLVRVTMAQPDREAGNIGQHCPL